MSSAPVPVAPDCSKPFEVVADACGVGIGAVLLQGGRPIAFKSRKLSPAEHHYTTGEIELLASVHAMRTWRCFLEGVSQENLTLVTDHNLIKRSNCMLLLGLDILGSERPLT